MKLTASIVTYNTPVDELHQCLGDLLADGVEHIYIIDNSPTGILKNIIGDIRHDGIISYTHRPDNPGYGGAHNIALRKALEEGTAYHLVINSDVSFERGTLHRITAYMDRHPDVGQLQPRILSPDGSEQFSSRLIPTPLDLINRRFLPRFIGKGRNRRYILADRPESLTLNIPNHQGSFMFFRVAALAKSGLFDERFFMYPEDIDLTRRMHELFATIYWPEVSVTHNHRASSYHSLKMLRIHMVNMIRYFNKWGWWHDPLRKRFNRRLLDTIASTSPSHSNES